MVKTKSPGKYMGKAAAIAFFVAVAVGVNVLNSRSSLLAQEGKSTEKPKIKTSLGEFEIESVQESDRFPPDCENPPSPGCDKAKEGYKILIIWLKNLGKEQVSLELYDISKGVYVTADDGSKTERFSGGGVFQKRGDGKDEPRLFVAFTPPSTAQNFKLSWPDNAPLQLSIDGKKSIASAKGGQ
jgi:hypothetical protein